LTHSFVFQFLSVCRKRKPILASGVIHSTLLSIGTDIRAPWTRSLFLSVFVREEVESCLFKSKLVITSEQLEDLFWFFATVTLADSTILRFSAITSFLSEATPPRATPLSTLYLQIPFPPLFRHPCPLPSLSDSPR